ncbi:MAG: hypothetical protein MZV70_17330 [Desulfobacterales bacterium]|nr:hypothetical protein [Desulfobacterales bacterium]
MFSLTPTPHQLLEGMAIAGHACGAHEGYLTFAASTCIRRNGWSAIHQAEEKGWLGENIQGFMVSHSIFTFTWAPELTSAAKKLR